jgi:nucleoside-diphosphate-sugar epimerase
VSVLEKPVEIIDHQVFNIGSDEENYTIAQIAAVVAREVGAEASATQEIQDARTYRVSFQKARAVLGFDRTVTLVDGVRELADALRAGQVNDYRSSRYSNVLHLTSSLSDALRRDKQLVELAELA